MADEQGCTGLDAKAAEDPDGRNPAEKRPVGSDDIDGLPFDEGPKKQKISFGFGKPVIKNASPQMTAATVTKKSGAISIKLGAQKVAGTPIGPTAPPKHKPTKVASVFNEDDDEPEEMPPEAKMRMKNIGRDTPTSAGPNSFGKTRHGFCDTKKMFEKHLKEASVKNYEELE